MFNPTVADAFLKRLYRPGFIVNTVASKSSRLYRLSKKNTNGSGSVYEMLVVADELAGASSDFSEAQTGATDTSNTVGSRFSIDWFEDNAVQRISGKAIAQSRNNDGAWTKLVRFAMDSCLRIAAFRNSIALATQGWGELCQLASVSGFTFKPKRSEHIHRLYKGMRIVFSSALNTATLRSATAIKITGIDPSSLLVTCDTALATPGGVNDDWAFTIGDRQNSATPARVRPPGLPVWIPGVRPVTDTTISTLFTIDRSLNGRLYGNYVDGTGKSIEQTLIELVQSCSSFGNMDGTMLITLSPNVRTRLVTELGDRKRFTDLNGKLGFKVLTIDVGELSAGVIDDKYFDDVYAWCVDPKEIEINSIGACPGINNDDGKGALLRVSDANAVEVRVVSYWNIGMPNPMGAGVALLPTS
jgi:hypothetical protein